MRTSILATTVAAGALLLAGCGTTAGSGSGSAADGGSSPSGAPAANAADLKTFSSPLGAIVVDGKGKTVYVFDSDTVGSNASACTGTCTSLWFPVTTASSTPAVQGVTGMVGTAPTAGGGRQVTLSGHRLYTFAGDSGSGQFTGQGFDHLWWVVSPAGEEIEKPAAAAPSSSMVPDYSY